MLFISAYEKARRSALQAETAPKRNVKIVHYIPLHTVDIHWFYFQIVLNTVYYENNIVKSYRNQPSVNHQVCLKKTKQRNIQQITLKSP